MTLKTRKKAEIPLFFGCFWGKVTLDAKKCKKQKMYSGVPLGWTLFTDILKNKKNGNIGEFLK